MPGDRKYPAVVGSERSRLQGCGVITHIVVCLWRAGLLARTVCPILLHVGTVALDTDVLLQCRLTERSQPGGNATKGSAARSYKSSSVLCAPSPTLSPASTRSTVPASGTYTAMCTSYNRRKGIFAIRMNSSLVARVAATHYPFWPGKHAAVPRRARGRDRELSKNRKETVVNE